MSVMEAKRLVESAYGSLIPETEFRTNGPATYYQIPGRAQRIGFIGARRTCLSARTATSCDSRATGKVAAHVWQLSGV
jgi:cyclic pyranopterin phosphate synthase